MTREEFNKLYLYKGVHCDTEEKANYFLTLAESVGYKWFSGSYLTGRNFWEVNEKETYYHITKAGVLFGNINHIEYDNCQIIEYKLEAKFIDDIIEEIKTKLSEINILLNRLEKKEKEE